jgi:hypothetical protein
MYDNKKTYYLSFSPSVSLGASTKNKVRDRSTLVKLLNAARRWAPTFNTLSRSITSIMKGHKVRTAILAALTRHGKKVWKLLIKPKEAGAFHLPGTEMCEYFTRRVITVLHRVRSNKKERNNKIFLR